ncbi:hypothetical protein ASC95_18215 [Pelomonas sp. Root1217]|uniref:hypothetical protein n=1 Tax=Pelomonas sp. Root1217 TaxID=1736430 RepID=UPI00070EA9C1|nr:hypothetical protein [Pelomonas sp. Root1217]KQV49524.1 hypothetical protein ASC95_18215 [Pelomonas sp. Root1217]
MSKTSRRLSVSLTANPALYVPQLPAGGALVGVVRRGLEIGALVRCQDGSYVKVNGDVIELLNPHHVKAALGRVRPARLQGRAQCATSPPAPSTAPVVTIKRRRYTVPA